jgi:microcystin-dependent protein
MSDPFLAEIRVMPYNFAPSGWAMCNGQLMPISQNPALFSLLGTNFGGDGRASFGLPNLMGSYAMGQGAGQGVSPRTVGEQTGVAQVSLTPDQLPSHTHALMGGGAGTATSPAGASMGSAAPYRPSGVAANMAAEVISPTGTSVPHENRQPYLALMFCIALQGIFPPRS